MILTLSLSQSGSPTKTSPRARHVIVRGVLKEAGVTSKQLKAQTTLVDVNRNKSVEH